MRYFNIPGSRTRQVLELPNNSNVGIPGRWMFRIDNAKIEAAGCVSEGRSLLLVFKCILIMSENLPAWAEIWCPLIIVVIVTVKRNSCNLEN